MHRTKNDKGENAAIKEVRIMKHVHFPSPHVPLVVKEIPLQHHQRYMIQKMTKENNYINKEVRVMNYMCMCTALLLNALDQRIKFHFNTYLQ